MSKHFELLQQLEKEQAFPSLSSGFPNLSRLSEARTVNPASDWASDEALRIVQQVFLQAQQPPKLVVFAGIEHGNGCSQISASVANALARNSSRPVCLVDANFRTPSLAESFNLSQQRGLADAILQDGPISTFAKKVSEDPLWLLPAGTLTADSPNLLSSALLQGRTSELRNAFDFVIADAPPLTRYSDAVVLGQLADGVVLIVEADTTKREAAAAVVANLRANKVPILAAVLNKRKFPIPQSIYSRL